MRGDTGALLRLAPRLQSPELQVEERDGEVFLLSSMFETLPSRDEVFALAQRFTPALRGALRVDGIHEGDPVYPQAVFERSEEGDESNTQFITLPAITVRAELFAPTVMVNGEVSRPAPLKAEAAARSDTARDVLGLYALEPSFVNLYRIVELVQEDVGGQRALDRRDWIPPAERRRLWQTANSRDAIGYEARHGTRQVAPPPIPMTLDEATALVGRLLERWLDSK